MCEVREVESLEILCISNSVMLVFYACVLPWAIGTGKAVLVQVLTLQWLQLPKDRGMDKMTSRCPALTPMVATLGSLSMNLGSLLRACVSLVLYYSAIYFQGKISA